MPALTVAAVLAGAGMLLVVGFDAGVTILHPAARGPLGRAVARITWQVAQRLARGRHERRVLSFAGPVAIFGTLATWLALAWLAFALIYVPFLPGSVATQAGIELEGDVMEALYLSGTALSTVGFGDIVPATNPLRLVTVVESLSGLVLVTSSITYLLSVNPYLLDVRRSAMSLAHLGALDVRGAAALAAAGGIPEVARVHSALVEAHENVMRFPVLLHFEPRDPEASKLTLLRGAAALCLALRWGVRPDALPGAALYGGALASTLEQIMEDYEQEFPHLAPPARSAQLGDATSADRVRRIRRIVAGVQPGLAAEGAAEPGLDAFLARVEGFLGVVAAAYRHPAPPLLPAA